jgi:apolipoprotein N-acyltransferase
MLGNRFVTAAQGRRATLAGLVLVAIAAIAGAIRLPGAPTPVVPDVRLRLVQPSIEQSLKWVEGRYDTNLRRHVELTLRPAEKQPTAIIWPEAAEPFPLDGHPENSKILGSILKPGQLLITGIDRYLENETPPAVRDSIQVLDSTGGLLATYDKFHYVPFGEYMPLGRWLPFIKAVAADSIEPTAGPGPETIRLPGLPAVGPLICYEVIFPNEVVNPKDRPDWLVDVTNDAWFGLSAGPYQHFAMMRVRAVEEGLPLANAANDGISGVVDPYGRVTARLGLGKIGVVDADLPKSIPATLYAHVGDSLFFIMVAGLAVIGFFMGRRRGPISQPPLL